MTIEVPDCFWEFSEVVCDECAEDGIDDVCRELGVSKHVVVPDKSVGDEGTTSSRWSHRTENSKVLQMHQQKGFPVIPSLVIHVLSNQLKRRLGSIRLFLGHIKVIYENYALLAYRRAVVSLSSLLHLAVDRILGLVGSRLCRKSESYVLVSV